MMESTNSVCQYSSYLELVHDQIIQCGCTVFYLSSLFLARFLRAERVFLLASQQRSIYGSEVSCLARVTFSRSRDLSTATFPDPREE